MPNITAECTKCGTSFLRVENGKIRDSCPHCGLPASPVEYGKLKHLLTIRESQKAGKPVPLNMFMGCIGTFVLTGAIASALSSDIIICDAARSCGMAIYIMGIWRSRKKETVK